MVATIAWVADPLCWYEHNEGLTPAVHSIELSASATVMLALAQATGASLSLDSWGGVATVPSAAAGATAFAVGTSIAYPLPVATASGVAHVPQSAGALVALALSAATGEAWSALPIVESIVSGAVAQAQGEAFASLCIGDSAVFAGVASSYAQVIQFADWGGATVVESVAAADAVSKVASLRVWLPPFRRDVVSRVSYPRRARRVPFPVE